MALLLLEGRGQGLIAVRFDKSPGNSQYFLHLLKPDLQLK